MRIVLENSSFLIPNFSFLPLCICHNPQPLFFQEITKRGLTRAHKCVLMVETEEDV